MRDPTVALADLTKLKVLLTIDPSNTDGLKNSKKQERHPTAGVVVKQLENIKATLQIGRNRVAQQKTKQGSHLKWKYSK